MKKPCCNPKWIHVPDYSQGNYLGTKKTKLMKVPCRKCVNCLWNIQREWMLRMYLEMEVSSYTSFVTLTYDNDFVGNGLNKDDLNRFIRSFRQKVNREFQRLGLENLQMSYFAVGEYGKKHNRPHYHLIMFNLPFHNKIELHNLIKSVWNKGFVYVEDACIKNIAYITKYITKFDPRQHDIDPFALCLFAPL